MPTKRARVSGQKLLQGFLRARPGQRAVVGGLMAPGRLESYARSGNGPWGSQSVRSSPAGCAPVPCRWPASPRLGGPKSKCGPGSPWSRSQAAGEAGGCAHRAQRPRCVSSWARTAVAPSRVLRIVVAFGRRTGGFYFWKPPPDFSSLLSTPCPLLGGTVQPPYYGRGRERNSSNTHFGTGKRAGGEGG